MYKTTILIPEYGKPNYLEVCIEAILKNSRYKHKILVVGGETNTGALDFRFDNNKNPYQKYKSIDEFLSKRKKWLEDNDVTFINTTTNGRRNKFIEEHERSGKTYHGGTDTALNDNIGVEQIDTKWFFWNWDDDFIAAPDWDINLLKHVDESRHDRVYLPTHVQPLSTKISGVTEIDPKDVWNGSQHISLHRITLPLDESYLLESKLNEFVKYNSRHDTIEERCGDRNRIHWLPMLIEKSLYLKAGGADYRGPGYDIGFDDKLRDNLGIVKLMARDSFIIHRAHMLWDVTGYPD